MFYIPKIDEYLEILTDEEAKELFRYLDWWIKKRICSHKF